MHPLLLLYFIKRMYFGNCLQNVTYVFAAMDYWYMYPINLNLLDNDINDGLAPKINLILSLPDSVPPILTLAAPCGKIAH